MVAVHTIVRPGLVQATGNGMKPSLALHIQNSAARSTMLQHWQHTEYAWDAFLALELSDLKPSPNVSIASRVF